MNAESTADEWDEQYRSKLCRLVAREMDKCLRRREDPEDVVQSAFRTFYRRNTLGEFQIDSAADLWRLLATITRRKILKHVEKLAAEKRNARREQSIEGAGPADAAPAPEDAAIAADLMERTLDGLDETYAAVFYGRLRRCTEEEIAAELGCTRAMVRMKLKRLRDRLERFSGESS